MLNSNEKLNNGNLTGPKTHNLLYLLEKIKLEPVEDDLKFIANLNKASIVTRYPEDIRKQKRFYRKEGTAELLKNTKRILKWLKEQ